MKKIAILLKKYGFYLATSVICIGALLAIFLMPNNEGNVKNEANPYARNEQTDANQLAQIADDLDNIVDEDDLDTTDENVEEPQIEESLESEDETATAPEIVEPSNQEVANQASEKPEEKPAEDTSNIAAEEKTAEQEVKTETFESTTVDTAKDPFFAEGDTFAWPVEGEIVVPYTDESTKHWFNEALNQTMRTFGICISAEEGSEVKAIAKGTVLEVVEDSSTYLDAGMPYVGQLMVIDHGNGYVSVYGFQNGTVNSELVGQVVNAGDVLGTVGSPKGTFVGLGDSIYLQVMHNDKVVNPLNYLAVDDKDIKTDSVDLGFAED